MSLGEVHMCIYVVMDFECGMCFVDDKYNSILWEC